jgi:hypothetical protein
MLPSSVPAKTGKSFPGVGHVAEWVLYDERSCLVKTNDDFEWADMIQLRTWREAFFEESPRIRVLQGTSDPLLCAIATGLGGMGELLRLVWIFRE